MQIEGVDTSTVAFVGPTERGPVEPTRITSVADFRRTFGGTLTATFGDPQVPQTSSLPHAVHGFFRNGGSRCFVARTITDAASFATAEIGDITIRAIGPGKWGNSVRVSVSESGSSGDGFDVVVRYWSDGIPSNSDGEEADVTVEESYHGLRLTETSLDYYARRINDASRLIDVSERATDVPTDESAVLQDGSDGGAIGPDDFDGREVPVDTLSGDTELQRTGLAGLAEVDEIAIVCIPDEGTFDGLEGLLLSHCEKTGDRFAILQTDRGTEPEDLTELDPLQTSDNGLAALYYPWLEVIDPMTNVETLVPPGGHVAGVYARTDTERGVHEPPANVQLRGVHDLERSVRREDRDRLTQIGINCIRMDPGHGIRVWGARTTSPNPDWRYVNVRRLVLYLEESIGEGTQWAMFESNNEQLWGRVRQSVGDFLTGVWRDGALQGNTPEEAFFVRCDRTTMTQDDIDRGRLIIEIGVAPLRPAEFITSRIIQLTGGADGP